MYATAGDTTFDIGVNVFGITVSTEADSKDGKEILRDLKVRNVSFTDAFDRILDAYESRGGEESPTIRVEENVPFGGGGRLGEQANDVVGIHEHRRLEHAAPSGKEAPQAQSFEHSLEDEHQEPTGQAEPARSDESTNSQPAATSEDQPNRQDRQLEQTVPRDIGEKSQRNQQPEQAMPQENGGEDQPPDAHVGEGNDPRYDKGDEDRRMEPSPQA